MAVKDKKIPFKPLAFIAYTFSFILSLVCYLIYAYLPLSDKFTNSPEVSGVEAVRVFYISPVAGFLSLIIFVVVAFSYRKYFHELSVADSKVGNRKIGVGAIEWISLIVTVLIAAMLLTSSVLALRLGNESRIIGFLAPFGDTVFKTYEYVILANCIVHFIFLVLTVIKMAGIHWLDGIASLFSKNKK